MCGIAGFVDFQSRLKNESLLKMTQAIEYRGPDDSGHSIFETENSTVGLGHRRLSIIDLSPLGHQPMTAGKCHIVFNGEIYNYKEIRQELEGLGHAFTSHSDTEVILKSFHQWGEQCVNRFIGMFAFALFNEESKELFLFRDRAGVKPLYYYWTNDLLLFGSELKSFHAINIFKKDIDLSALGLFLQYGYIPAPHTIFKQAFKVKPGCFVKIDLASKSIIEVEYWNVLTFYNKPKLDISLSEAIEETEKIIASAFNYRMVADVPVGVFLSGGYDSTALASILTKSSGFKLKTFSIGFEESAFNEAPYAKQIANYLGTEHSEHYCTHQEALDIIPKLPQIFDEPFGDSSAIPTTLVSRMAVKEVKVALSADAGDETFAGYGRYKTFIDMYKKLGMVPKSARPFLHNMTSQLEGVIRATFKNSYNLDTRISKIKQILANGGSFGDFNKILSQHFSPLEVGFILHEYNGIQTKTSFDDTVDSKFNDELNTLLALDYRTYMVDDVLTKVDRASMSVSLEAREPLLDHRIIQFVAQLPSNMKYRNGTTKYILKDIVHRHVPRNLVDRPKMGFGAPVETWLKNDLRSYVEDYLGDDRLKRNPFINAPYVSKSRAEFLAGRKVNSNKIWYLLMFQMWYQHWME